MHYSAKVLVRLKPDVKDSKARVLESVIERKDYAQAPVCHCGKFYQIEIESQNLISAEHAIEQIAREILANSVIECYEILSLEEVSNESRDYSFSGN